MCKRPSRSENSTVTALTPFWSVNHLTRSSWSLSTDTRFLRCSLAFKLSSSSSSYDNSRKLRYSMDISSPVIVEIEFTYLQSTTKGNKLVVVLHLSRCYQTSVDLLHF